MRKRSLVSTLLKKTPKLVILVLILVFTMLLDGLAYGLFKTCASCTSYTQFLTNSTAASAPIIASISSLFSLTKNAK